MRWCGREREKETLGKRGERERKLYRWDVKKKKDVKEWRKRKKQGAEKKKRVNHKNSDLQEWVGRRKEDGGKRKVQESDWRPSLRLEKRGYGSHCGPPSPLLLYFSSPRMPNSFLQPCVMFLPGNKTQPLTQTHARTQAHTHPPQNALLEQLDPNVHACSDTQYIQRTVTCRVWLPQHTNNSVVCTDTHTRARTHTHANSSAYAWEEKRERKKETEVKDRATARVCGCEMSTAQVIRQPVS